MKLFANKIVSKGFTLIELLIVISILGILSAALIATIDPLEQIKKSQDTDLKNKAGEFYKANIRYYTNHSASPWFSTANGGSNCYTGGATFTNVAVSTLGTCLTALVNDGELKQGFSNSSNLDKIYVTTPNPLTGNTADATICFLPTSKAQQKDANTKYAQNGANGTNCKSAGGTANCYWCAQ